MSDEPIGKRRWSFAGGFVPVESTGPEPEMVSHEKLAIVNAGDEMATVELTLHYENGRVAGPYTLTTAPQRVRHVRVNDLIEPYAPPLGRAYSGVLESTAPVVVQVTRQDTRQSENATMGTGAYAEST
ncbi:sensory rhodopsin transducer [Natronobiforma cellulositropha]|uniref:sensory rhodopsin transducer n=1 Tax=Natronobiforma cellulositropha TaxID=1679076 RepID=UPI0021D5D605|nr:sensory rhodopsin transducer [Natronobiforma cellulositropha]